MATDKQVKYALHLLAQNGYDTKWMDSTFKNLGAKMRERSGSVTGWLEGMTNAECSELIQELLD